MSHGIDWDAVERRVRERDETLQLAIHMTNASGGRACFIKDGHYNIELEPPSRYTARQYIDALNFGVNTIPCRTISRKV